MFNFDTVSEMPGVSFGGVVRDVEGAAVTLLVAILSNHAVQQTGLHVHCTVYTSTSRSDYKRHMHKF